MHMLSPNRLILIDSGAFYETQTYSLAWLKYTNPVKLCIVSVSQPKLFKLLSGHPLLTHLVRVTRTTVSSVISLSLINLGGKYTGNPPSKTSPFDSRSSQSATVMT